MTPLELDWSEFHRRALLRPPRELLRRTIGAFRVQGQAPGIAVDLGCGSGTDTAELLRTGWEVHAVDPESAGLELLLQALPPDARKKLHTHTARMEDFEFPRCDLVWAGYSLPYCEPALWPSFWGRAKSAVNEGGRIAGDFFGPEHAFAQAFGAMVLSEEDARHALRPFIVEAFDIENGYRPSGQEMTRWHAFGFSAVKRGEGGA